MIENFERDDLSTFSGITFTNNSAIFPVYNNVFPNLMFSQMLKFDLFLPSEL